MATNAQVRDKPDPRPKYIHLGTDTAGHIHIWDVHRHRVLVHDPGQDYRRVRTEPLGDRPIRHWMAFVAHERGWRDQRYHDDLGEALAENIQMDQ